MSERSKNNGNILKKIGAGLIAAPVAAVALSACTSAEQAPSPTTATTASAGPERSQSGVLELSSTQIQQVDTAARGTALVTMREVKGNGPGGYNGYGQLMFTHADAKNHYGTAVWVRGSKGVDGTKINLEMVEFESTDGSLENAGDKIFVSHDLNFVNPTTDVFNDGRLTSEEAVAVFADPNTHFVDGSKEVDASERKAAYVTLDGSAVTAQDGAKVTSYNSNGDPLGLSMVEDPSRIQGELEWVINKA